MSNIIRSPESKRELAEIWAYIAEHNFDAADRLVAEIDEMLNLLARMPGAGRARPEYGKDLRSVSVHN